MRGDTGAFLDLAIDECANAVQLLSVAPGWKNWLTAVRSRSGSLPFANMRLAAPRPTIGITSSGATASPKRLLEEFGGEAMSSMAFRLHREAGKREQVVARAGGGKRGGRSRKDISRE